jgi:hypothetical protein
MMIVTELRSQQLPRMPLPQLSVLMSLCQVQLQPTDDHFLGSLAKALS